MNEQFAILRLFADHAVISPCAVELVEDYALRWRMSGFHALLQTQVLSETEIANALSEHLKIDRLFHVRTLNPSPEGLQNIGFRRARRYECLPLGESAVDDRRCEIVIADPTRTRRIENLSRDLGHDISLAVSERSDIMSAIDELYPVGQQLPFLMGIDAEGS